MKVENKEEAPLPLYTPPTSLPPFLPPAFLTQTPEPEHIVRDLAPQREGLQREVELPFVGVRESSPCLSLQDRQRVTWFNLAGEGEGRRAGGRGGGNVRDW